MLVEHPPRRWVGVALDISELWGKDILQTPPARGHGYSSALSSRNPRSEGVSLVATQHRYELAR